MKRILVLFGNITFEENTAIIHNIDGFVYIDEDKAEQFAEDSVNLFDAYIIPSKYKGIIKREC